jgi:pSer/pThr/pTyr-binding forkhead associated (FHA) protein
LLLLQNRQFRNALAGAIGGFLSWLLIVEPFFAPRIAGPINFGALLALDAVWGGVVGLGIGLSLGVAEGLVSRSWYQARRGGLIGGGLGLLGGALGLVVGELVYQPLAWLCFVGRAVGWGVFGAILGASEGLTRRSWLGVRNGMLGGLIGGAVGGFMFDLVGIVIVTLTGLEGLSRGVAITILGALIGFWLAALERALSPARLKVISGQLEGKEFLLDKPRLTIGSDERCDIAIFGDAQIAAQHAVVRWKDEVFALEAAPGAATTINGQAVTQQVLQSEDQLVLGKTRCVFRLKTAKAGVMPAAQPSAPYAVMTPSTAGTAGIDSSGWRSDFPAPAAPVAPVTGATTVTQLVELRSGRRFALTGATLSIGRDPGNDIMLDDATISGRHALIECSSGRCIVYDQGSRNGVYVNGRRIGSSNLVKPGWQIQLGDVVLQAE